MELDEIILKAVNNQKITQAALAKKIGVLPQTLNAAKKGRRGLPDEACEKLAEAANTDFGDVIRARMRQRGSVSINAAIMTAAFMIVTLFITHAATTQAGSSFQTVIKTLCKLCELTKKMLNQIIAAGRNSWKDEKLNFDCAG